MYVESSRIVKYDLLRILAILFVILTHLSAESIVLLPSTAESYLEWKLAVRISALARIGVPLFVMLSGAFLLKPDKVLDIKNVFLSYIPSKLLVFILWSGFYALHNQHFFYFLMVHGCRDAWNSLDKGLLLDHIIEGHYHMWYLYMLFGLYMITPLLKLLIIHARKEQLIYFILLCILFNGITKFNQELWNLEILTKVLDKMSLGTFSGYVGYFLAGYLFSQYKFSVKTKIILGISAVFSYIYVCESSFAFTVNSAFTKFNFVFLSNYSPFIFMITLAVFLLFSSIKETIFNQKFKSYVRIFVQSNLVIYLLHPYIMELLNTAKLFLPREKSINILVNGLLVYFLCLMIALIMRILSKFIMKGCSIILNVKLSSS